MVKITSKIEFLGFYPLSNHAKEEYDRFISGVDYYYVIVSAGQSNSMAFGEGTPDYLDLDKPDIRIKQMARRKSTQTSVILGNESVEVGTRAEFNDIIALDHCPHDVVDMSVQNNPNMDERANFQDYGCHSQLLNICKKLLPSFPKNAGILVVPCSAVSSGFNADLPLGDLCSELCSDLGASEHSRRWGVETPLYKDMLQRTRIAMQSNKHNILLGVLWTQGESDMEKDHSEAIDAFEKMRANFNELMLQEFEKRVSRDSKDLAQSVKNIPWFCGDTTYWWIENFKDGYEKIYGNYKNRESENIFFCEFSRDFSMGGVWTATNNINEDIDSIYKSGARYSSSRYRIDKQRGQTSSTRELHFSTKSRQGIVSDVVCNMIKKVFKL